MSNPIPASRYTQFKAGPDELNILFTPLANQNSAGGVVTFKSYRFILFPWHFVNLLNLIFKCFSYQLSHTILSSHLLGKSKIQGLARTDDIIQ